MRSKRVVVSSVVLKAAPDPRLRFDKVAVGLVSALKVALSGAVPDGKLVVLTITAPIRRDAQTCELLEPAIHALLKSRRVRLETTMLGNRIQVRVLKGATGRVPKLIGFVHNPKPDPAVLFDVTRRLLATMARAESRAERWLIIDNHGRGAPLGTVRQVCSELRTRAVFKKILLADPEGVRVL